jgi:short-subunit dehydrogenase
MQMDEQRRGPRIIALGALSAIGKATLALYAAEGADLVLVGRDVALLDQFGVELGGLGAGSVHAMPLDLAACPQPAQRFAEMVDRLGGAVDLVFVFYGALGTQADGAPDAAEARSVIETNFASAAEWCLAAADTLERQGSGTLLVLSSVAGDRGRRSNYIYGAAKAGLSVLVQGLAHRLAGSRARAVVVKAGFVATPMTAHVENKGMLWASPDRVAAAIHRAAQRSAPVVYVPWFWRYIMAVLRCLPAWIFHRLNI